MDLLVSQDCNMACRYCFAEEGMYCGNKGLMTWEIARNSVDFLIKNSGKSKELHITFFGGEPLLNIPIIKKVVEYSKSKTINTDKKITFSVSTNGTFLEEELVNYFIENKINVQISIDGGADSQNFNRLLAGGEPSYNRVINKSKNLVQKNNKITARATVTKNNIDSIKNDAEHLLSLGFCAVHIEHAAGSWNNDLLINGKADFKILTDNMLELYDLFETKLEKGELLKINNFLKMLHVIHKRSRKFYGCGAGRGYLCVDINGDISTCHRLTGNKKHDLGNINRENLSLEKLKKIKEKS